MEYGSFIYSICSDTYRKSIEVVTRKALRLINGHTKSTPVNALHCIASEPPHEIRRNFICNKSVFKVIAENGHIFKQLNNHLASDPQEINNADSISLENDKITLTKGSGSTSILKKDFSNCEYFFLKNYNKNMNHIRKVPNICYNNFTNHEPSYPIINMSLKNAIVNKSSKTPVELKQMALNLISNFDNDSFIYTDASIKGERCSIGVHISKLKANFGFVLSNPTSLTFAELHGFFKGLTSTC